jgi:hypothetical protein
MPEKEREEGSSSPLFSASTKLLLNLTTNDSPNIHIKPEDKIFLQGTVYNNYSQVFMYYLVFFSTIGNPR